MPWQAPVETGAALRDAALRPGATWRNRSYAEQQLEQLTPVTEDDPGQAAQVMQNFAQQLAACRNDIEAQHELVSPVLERVYVRGQDVTTLTLKSTYHLVLGHNVHGSTAYALEPCTSVSDGKNSATCGDDGGWVTHVYYTGGVCADSRSSAGGSAIDRVARLGGKHGWLTSPVTPAVVYWIRTDPG